MTALAALLLLIAQPLGSMAQSPVVPATPTLAPLPSPAPDALRVVTTTTVFADIVRNVAREHADVVSIIPAGVGPEDYEPKPADAQLLADADLIVSNGVGLDDFLQKLLQSGTGGQTPQLVLGSDIPTITVDGEANPHFWLDPTLVAQYYVPAIIGALSTLDPAHGADYGTNGMAYVAQLDALDTQLQEPSWRPSRRRTGSWSRSMTRSRTSPALRLRARGCHPGQRRRRAVGRGTRRPRGEGQGGRRAGGLQRGPVQPRSWPRPWPRRRASPRW